MHRVCAHHFKKSGNDWVPFIVQPDGSFRQVRLVAQPGGAEAFLALLEREGLHSGPRGTGKTLNLLETFLQHVGVGYGAAWRGLLIRLTMTGFPEVKQMLEEYIIAIWGDAAHFNQNQNLWTWDSGESLKLGFFSEEKDYATYIGSAYPWLGYEELSTHANDKAYKQMLACNRSSMSGIPLMIRSTCNPGDVGGIWVRRRFQPPPEPKEGYVIGPRVEDKDGLSKRAVCSVLAQNQRLLVADPTYLKTIQASAFGTGYYEAWTTGSWNVQAGGLMEAVWLEASSHFTLPPISPESIPPSWQITRGFDWGETSPFAWLWVAISDGSPITLPDGRKLNFIRGDTIVFDELYGCIDGQPNTGVNWTIDEIKRAGIAREIANGLRYQNPATAQWVYRVKGGVADDQIFNPQSNRDNAESMADEFSHQIKIDGVSQRGVVWEEADKSPGSRVRGWTKIRGMLHATIPNANGGRENAGLFICSDCVSLMSTLQALPRDPKKPEDCTAKAEDHLPDALRYVLGRDHTPRFRSYRAS